MRSFVAGLCAVLCAVSMCGCSMVGAVSPKIETIMVMPAPSPELDPLNYTSEEQALVDTFYDIEAPDFELPDENGNMVALSDYEGNIVVLCFFATWSKYCLEEFEFLSRAQEDFPEVVFLAVSTGERRDMSTDENKAAIVACAREHGLSLPILFDEDSSVYDQQYYMRGVPATFIIDSEGRIRNIISGSVSSYSELKPYVSSVEKFEYLQENG